MKLTPPTAHDVDRLARLRVTARLILWETAPHEDFDGSEADLARIQRALDSGTVDPEQTEDYESLGVAFGEVVRLHVPELEWAIIEDEYGRDLTLRYEETSLTLNVVTLFTKRMEWDEEVDVRFLYEELLVKLDKLSRDVD